MAPTDQNIGEAAFIHSIKMLNRAYDQTVEEWLEEYDTGVPVIPAAWSQKSVPANTEEGPVEEQIVRMHLNACKVTSVSDVRAEPLKLFYQTYRTTQRGSLAVVLTDWVEELEYIAWFNIEKTAKRGNRNIRTGHKGYFYPNEFSRFRKFWLKYICHTETVWGSVHRKLPSRFRKLTFTGTAELAVDSDGGEYIRVKDFRVLQLLADD